MFLDQIEVINNLILKLAWWGTLILPLSLFIGTPRT